MLAPYLALCLLLFLLLGIIAFTVTVRFGSLRLAHLRLLFVDHDLDRLLGAPFWQLEVVPWDAASFLDDLEEDTELVQSVMLKE